MSKSQNVFSPYFVERYRLEGRVQEFIDMKRFHPKIRSPDKLKELDHKLVFGYIHQQIRYGINVSIDVAYGIFNYYPRTIPKPQRCPCVMQYRHRIEEEEKRELRRCLEGGYYSGFWRG